MCTAVSYQTRDHYFGRNLDLEHSYIESVVITPRNYPFQFQTKKVSKHHYAIIGIAAIVENYPLYYDATNEHGLSMAGLNFPGNAIYQCEKVGKDNIAPYEFIPWVLSKCKTVAEAKKLLEQINLAAIPFNKDLPLSPLHWMLSDKECSLVIEPEASGITIHDNPIGVLTNNPPFQYHLYNLCNYMNLSAESAVNRFSKKINLQAYSRGMGAVGLPGDLSSSSRFIKVAFTKLNSVAADDEAESVSQFFHILGSVEQQQGCVILDGGYERTIYSSCCNTEKGIYYYKTYCNSQITAVNMHHEDLNSQSLKSYPLRLDQQIFEEN